MNLLTQHISASDIKSLEHKIQRFQKEETFKLSHQYQFNSLTTRELEIVNLLVKDLNNSEIAQKLFISRLTVEQHRKNINRKLNVRTPFQLFRYALAFDLV
ncbi:transcriptional regulator, LuxR family protein [Fulvivirga imtechensis AK7]|uniref:Transcriptional regulator, LuxR family protein n=1 Tax=Fulvivirga imtechensis AK7 TaxID=1237149 RepID=L8JMV8_9BACT|nr:helix-turn-helix transcriptional regulator [Fulvivirga imtechensis]ELR68839.1 transcriptional regulator, LuxR family protein [Fulvivirga imtechensis AK7]